MPNPARNEELRAKYDINAFPTVLLMTPDGEVFGSTGNNGTPPEEYAAHVLEMRTKGRKALEDARAIVAEYEKSQDKAAVVRKAVTALNAAGPGQGPGATLAGIVRNGLTLDPENKGGLKLESLKCLVLNGHAARGEMDLALEMDLKNALGLYEAVVAAEYQAIDGPEAMQAFLDHAQVLFDAGVVHQADKVAMAFAVAAYMHQNENGDLEKAKPFARKALELGGLPDYVSKIMTDMVGAEG